MSDNPSPYNEKALLQLVAAGDQSAYQQLFNDYWDQVFSTILLFTKSPALSEDLTQDVFARIWIKRDKLAGVDKFDGYLFIVARNLVFNRFREEASTVEYSHYLEEYFSDTSLVPDDRMVFKELDHLIRAGIDKLPAQQQKAFRLSRFEGLSHEEIAAVMQISRSAVKSHIVRAILHLRKHLEQYPGRLLLFSACYFS